MRLPSWTQNDVGNVGRALTYEVNAHALRANQANHLLNLVGHGFARAVEEHVGLVEEENQLRQVLVAHFGQGGVEFAQEPKQEGGVNARLEHEFVGGKHVHNAFAGLGVFLQQVVDVERGQAEEFVGAVVFERQQGALNGSHAGRCNIPIFCCIFAGVFRNVVEHGAQVLQVVDEQAAFVGNAEHDVDDAGLRVVQVEQAGQKVGAHVAHPCAHRVSLLAKHVEQAGGAGLELRIGHFELVLALFDEARRGAHLADAAQVAFHIGHEARHAHLAERLGQNLQRHRLTRTRGARHEAVPVRHLTQYTQSALVAVGNV